ncbi:hypothetical protein [Selenomonas sp. F0473]|uniref:hypothetical protein n=1 Tax=Selenomonas sp. F0473 TaxID=999423 RepID=UPI00029E2DAF|nr:hypothetical protein [Selenomonas sp. F0473]EKU70564.1 hypothetical protein HMPREF9161_01610 [Selenomonas sp. F0473]
MDNEQNTQPDAQHTAPKAIVVQSIKNVGLAAGLALFFGPIGMLYSTIMGAVVMLIVNIIVGLFTLGFGLIVTLPIGAIWAYIAAKKYNENLLAGARE